jgi:ABC-2 type transport system ATP-binding protein
MLELVNLRKRYPNGVLAVDGVNLAVQPGEIFVLLGANGAGKTTTINLIMGFIDPTEGDALLCGKSIVKEPLEAKKHAAYVSENVMLYGNFTAMQNVRFFTRLAGRKSVADEEYHGVLDRVGLERSAHRMRVKHYSKGMRQRLGIAIAILKQADVICLDEPTSGLDPKGGQEFLELLRSLKEEKKAIFMSSHDIFRTKVVADRVGIMNKGRILRIMPRGEMEAADLEGVYLREIETEVVSAAAAQQAKS